jgi:cytochrome c2
LQLINPSTSPNELNTTLTPHSIIHGDACFAYFNKIWGIPVPGNNMKPYGGLTSAEDRAKVIVFLESPTTN